MDDRRTERLTSETEVFTLVRGARQAHRCRNISHLGCMIALDGMALATGDDLEVELAEGTVIPSRVIWARQGFAGLAFKCAIKPATVRQLASADQISGGGVARLIPERFTSCAA
ncbi:PilZ domain-containing protein [Qipengyuania sp.]|uniref:PilZ domain-containing protein n=1 Tax=Qipengyuania sp. TaxID=2004515 RepID=UPI0035C7949D